MKTDFFRGKAVPFLLLVLAVGCGARDSSPLDLTERQGGVVSADFQTLDDYLDHPTVQLLFEEMDRHQTLDPLQVPQIDGTYAAYGGVVDSTIPDSLIGDSMSAYFCFGLSSEGELEARVIDPAVDESWARSFIEGDGNDFTVYTAFSSVQQHPDGGHCEITKVNVFSATRENDGSLSDLHIGYAVVGLIGDCYPLLIGQARVSLLSGTPVGEACSSIPQGPADDDKVQVVIENFLLDSVNIFAGPGPFADASVDPLATAAIEIDPGFSLDFESARPSAGTDQNGDDILMGEVVAGAFEQDTAAAGETVTYIIENLVGIDEFFSPRLKNSSSNEVYVVVNSGVPTLNFLPYEEPFGTGLEVPLDTPANSGPLFIGYYSHDSPGFITPSEANVRVFDTSDDSEVTDPFLGPFSLAAGSGDVILEVTD